MTAGEFSLAWFGSVLIMYAICKWCEKKVPRHKGVHRPQVGVYIPCTNFKPETGKKRRQHEH